MTFLKFFSFWLFRAKSILLKVFGEMRKSISQIPRRLVLLTNVLHFSPSFVSLFYAFFLVGRFSCAGSDNRNALTNQTNIQRRPSSAAGDRRQSQANCFSSQPNDPRRHSHANLSSNQPDESHRRSQSNCFSSQPNEARRSSTSRLSKPLTNKPGDQYFNDPEKLATSISDVKAVLKVST